MEKRTIVAFGNFDLEGARSWVIRTGLQEADWQIALCRTDARGLLKKYRDLLLLWRECRAQASAIYVVFLGHYLMPLAWLLGKRAGIPVIFDAFLSLHETEVHDRRRVSRWSPKAWILWMTDWLSCRLADVVLLDTEEDKNFFVKTYGVDAKKILVLPVGARTDLFTPAVGETGQRQPSMAAPTKLEIFRVEFHGTYIPLQGAEVILAAAQELQKRGEAVQFTLVGTQMERALMPRAAEWGLRNVRFSKSVPLERIPGFIHDADVCLGIFGVTAKAARVIPNKAYEVLACGKPLITARTPAAERVFADCNNALLCTPGDAVALADAILLLKNDPALRAHIAKNGLALSRAQFQPRTIIIPLLDWLSRRR